MLLFCKLQLDVASAPSSSTPLSTHQSSAESPSVRSSSHSASSSTQLTSQPLATNSSLLPSSFTSPVSSSDLPPSSPPSSRIPPQAPGLRVASWNARSLTDKHAFVTQSLLEGNLDLLAVTESWHHCSEDASILRATPAGYSSRD